MSRFDGMIGMELAASTWTWSSDRALLYAVGVGCGQEDPTQELAFSTENTDGVPQQVLPSFLTLMAPGTKWMKPLGFKERVWEGISWGWPEGLVHGDQGITLLRPLPPAGSVDLRLVLKAVYDKGANAVVIVDTEARLSDSQALLGVATGGYVIRGQGGFGGERGPADSWSLPDRAPDITVVHRTSPGQSLIYRLSGDHNPHCTDPNRARLDGFPRPIFQGLGTFGFGCRAILQGLCDGDVARFGHMQARFSQPMFPGQELVTRIWRADGGAQFQTFAEGKVVLDRGVFRSAA